MELTTVDSFTSVPFTGNPAAIAMLDSFPDDSVMQGIAREMNLSEDRVRRSAQRWGLRFALVHAQRRG